MCCLLRAKRGARLPRPPLDPPIVGPAAFGSVCPPFEQRAHERSRRSCADGRIAQKRREKALPCEPGIRRWLVAIFVESQFEVEVLAALIEQTFHPKPDCNAT